MFVTAVAVSSSALALALWLDAGVVAQALTLVAAWLVTAAGRFALLRSWVFREPPAEVTRDTVITRT
jgi:hypothetical protein